MHSSCTCNILSSITVVILFDCSVCDFETTVLSKLIACSRLQTYAILHSNSANIPASCSRGPNLDRPRVDASIGFEDWNVLINRWNVFDTVLTSMSQTSTLAIRLFHCVGEALCNTLLKLNPRSRTNHWWKRWLK